MQTEKAQNSSGRSSKLNVQSSSRRGQDMLHQMAQVRGHPCLFGGLSRKSQPKTQLRVDPVGGTRGPESMVPVA